MASDQATPEELAAVPAPPRPSNAEDTAADRLDDTGIPGKAGTQLVRATNLTGMAVVTLEGDREIEIKDVVFDKDAGGITGFTLRKPGFLGGPQPVVLPISGVTAIGKDAVMVKSHALLADATTLAGSGDDVLGDQVITDQGTALGTVADVIASISDGNADIVGFEVIASDALGNQGDHIFIPLPAALAISGEAIVVPASVANFSTPDYLDLNTSVQAFRNDMEAS